MNYLDWQRVELKSCKVECYRHPEHKWYDHVTFPTEVCVVVPVSEVSNDFVLLKDRVTVVPLEYHFHGRWSKIPVGLIYYVVKTEDVGPPLGQAYDAERKQVEEALEIFGLEAENDCVRALQKLRGRRDAIGLEGEMRAHDALEKRRTRDRNYKRRRRL